eukprot:jgi/Undpi1/5318/HiC_scaffold_2.g00599.m1
MRTEKPTDGPSWSTLSTELAAVLRKNGPVLIGEIAGAYKVQHGKNFDLCGYRLRGCLDEGKLRGLRLNQRAGGSYLVLNTADDAKTPSVAAATRRTAPSRKAPKAVASATRSTSRLTTKCTSTATNISTNATQARKSAPATISEASSNTNAIMASGITIRSSTATAFDMSLGRATNTPSSTVESTSSAHPGSVPPAQAMFETGGAENTPPPPAGDQKGEHQPAYLMVDSSKTCAEFIGPSLKNICEGHAIAVQLEGRRLGSEDGSIAIIKIGGSWPHPAALMFDVFELERTPEGHQLLRDQLLPMLQDDSITKVVHDFTSSAIALKRHFRDAFAINRVMDTQFALEALRGDIRGTVGSVIKVFAGENDLFSDAAYRATAFDHRADSNIPISPHELNRAARTVNSLAKAGEIIMQTGLTKEKRNHVLQASELKISFAICNLDHARWISFRDEGKCWGGGVGRVMTSYEMKKS